MNRLFRSITLSLGFGFVLGPIGLREIMFPMCDWPPLVPVTYQPPQRSTSGLAWSVRNDRLASIGCPCRSTESERTRCPGIPWLDEELWQSRQDSTPRIWGL